jgi:hypothetical protein
MKAAMWRALAGLIAAGTLAGPAGAASPAGLEAYRWRSRLVVVFAPTPADARLAAQRAALATLAGSGDGRDLVLVEVVGQRASPPGVDASALRHRFHVAPGAFRALLIGKDGGVKLDGDAVLGAAKLAATIDAMPMRREEMRR